MAKMKELGTQPVLDVAVRLRTTAMALTRRLRALAPADALSPARLGILGHLYRSGPMSPTELASLERVKLQTLTRVLAELEAQSLIRRRPHRRDARQSVLTLAPAGKRLLQAEIGWRETSIATALERALTATEQEQLLAACALIERVTAALDTGSAAASLPAKANDDEGQAQAQQPGQSA